MRPIKIGLVGTGSISNAHMTGYSKLAEEGKVELVAACDINVDRARAWAEKYGFKEVYGSHTEMLEKSDIDAISICTWNNSHAQITIDALRAGKHVLCEKPPAMTVEQALQMQQAEKESGKLLMIGFVRRFGDNAQLVLDFANNGFFGDVNFAKIAVTRRCGCPLGWFANSKLSGGGPLLDNGVHLIDLVRYLTGKPKAVSCYASTYNNMGSRTNVKGVERYASVDPSDFNDVEDLAVGMVKFDNGMTMSLEFSYSEEIEKGVIGVEIYGSKGGAIVEPHLTLMTEMNNYMVNITPQIDHPTFEFSKFYDEINHFIDSINGVVECRNRIEDGVELMRIITSMYESARTGHEVIIQR
ncbi:MAG: Gfo/Idh/MocA family oxidoreductase [Clostridia bacterium]|nr:Gfo/Idh/MocA family oxidoreductase [Clostridia bacterium]